MIGLEALDSVLEVGIGIAGFSGVIIAFNRGHWSIRQLHLLPTLLDLSFITLFLGFVPMVLIVMALSDETVWRIASCLATLYLVAILPLRSSRLSRLGIDYLSTGRIASLALHLAMLGLSTANMLWLATFWPHLAVLVTLLLLAFGVFAQLVSELWARDFEDSNPNDLRQASTERR